MEIIGLIHSGHVDNPKLSTWKQLKLPKKLYGLHDW